MGVSAANERNKCVSKALDSDFDRNGFASFLRKLYPYDTAANVAADAKVSDRTVDNWLATTSEPRASVLLRLVARYGPALLAAAYHNAPPWLDEAKRAVRMAQLEEELAQLRGK